MPLAGLVPRGRYNLSDAGNGPISQPSYTRPELDFIGGHSMLWTSTRLGFANSAPFLALGMLILLRSVI